MNPRSPCFILLIVSLSFSGCFTPSVRTATIPIKDAVVSISLGAQFTYEKDPLTIDAPTVDQILYFMSTMLNGLGVEFGTTFFDDDGEGGLDCSVGLIISLGQQDIHPRCAVLQQEKGDPLSVAVGYKLSFSVFLHNTESELGESFFVGHGATVDANAWFGNTVSPIINLEVGQTLIPDKTKVELIRQAKGKVIPPRVSTSFIFDWMLKSTAGLALRFNGDRDLSESNDPTILFGFTPIFQLDGFGLKGYEAATVVKIQDL